MELKFVSPYEINKNNLGIKKNQMVSLPLAESFREFGVIAPVLVDIEGNVIDGNERVEMARKLRIDKVPVIQTDLTVEQGKKYAVIHNHIQGLCGWNYTPKKNLVEELKINKGMYHMADEIREMEDINGMFTKDDAISLFDFMQGESDEDNSSGL